MPIDDSTTVAACPACAAAPGPAVGAPAAAFDAGGGLVHPGYAILACRTCDLRYKSHRLSDAALDRYYATLDPAPFDLPYLFPTDRRLLAHLADLRPGARVLDFGCSTGRLLAALPPGTQRIGIEIGAAAAAVARGRGVTIVEQAALEADTVGRFDAILMTDVYEHLAEPLALVRLLGSRLAPGGRLVIVTGLADALPDARLAADYWYFRLPSHLMMATHAHLRWLAHATGLTLAAAEPARHYAFAPRRWLRESVQMQAYRLFRFRPRSLAARLAARIPVIRAARRWPAAPATEQRRDHVVAVLAAPASLAAG